MIKRIICHPFFRGTFLFSCIIALLPVRVKAQDSTNTIGNVSIASPTAASLGKYGDIPVSYNTGIPQISIPIYTCEAGSLKLPISLSYHASGLKVQEPAGWVGAGWALNAGGVITRTVNGGPDEKGTTTSEQYGHFSDFGYNSYLYNGIQDWQGFAQGRKDGQPDFFFFNFGSYTGKFYFRDDRTPILVPQQDLQIVPNYTGTGSIQSFVVTTPDGDQYTFGPTAVESTNPITIQTSGAGTTISSWFLTKIATADNQFSINLNYVAENYGYYTVSMFPIDGGSGSVGEQEFKLAKNVVTGVRLSQISFPNGTVTFTGGAARTDLSDNVLNFADNVNTSSTTLGSIQIANSSGFCKNYNLFYGYFSDATTTLPITLTAGYTMQTDEKRLRLDSVQETSCDGSIKIPSYKFNYYAEQVPRRLSFGIDHWGFYNGVNNNTRLIPTTNINNTVVPGANRDAAWPAMRGGSLYQITYPTGGYSLFNFEPNSVYTSYSTNSFVQAVNVQIGFDAGVTPMSGTYTLNGSPYTVNLSNTTPYNATVAVFNSSNTEVQSYAIGPNFSQQTSLTLTPGTYTFTISWVGSNIDIHGGTGAAIIMGQYVPQNISSNTVIGGLRIKSLTNNDGYTPTNIVTNYSYLNNSGQSTGILYSQPVYVQILRNDLIEELGFSTVPNAYVYNSINSTGCPYTNEFYQSPSSIRPMASMQGNHIGYSQVTVSQAGNGYSIYNYYINNSGYAAPVGDVAVRTIANTASCDPSIPNYPAAPLPFDSKRGELYYEQHFNNSGQLLKDMYYYPVFDNTSILTTPGFIVAQRAGPSGAQLFGTVYSLGTIRKTMMTTVEDDYTPGAGYITKTSKIYYGSAFHNQPTRKLVTTSTGDSLITNIKYAYDYRITNCDTISSCTPSYTTACNSCLSTYNSANTACAGNSNCLFNAYAAYMLCLSNARVSYVSCRQANFFNPTNHFAACHLSYENSADTLLKPVYRLQDEFYNAPIEVSDWKDLNLTHASFTKYDTSLSPVGFVYPGRTQLINLQATSASFTNSAVSGNTISKDSRYADETIYKFSNGNPLQVTPYSGVANSYVWDYLNTKPIAKISNTTADQVAYTSFEADGQGGWSFTGATTADATSPTGNKCYGLSAGSVSKYGLFGTTSYVVSYWSKTGSSFTITGSTAVKQGKTINGWTYFEHTVTGTTSVTVSGSGSIDELRLYPTTAQMTTYTYTPLLGMTSACDVNNKITSYFYDGLGRLKWVKDQDGNIIKTIQYHYQTIAGLQY